jgi:hypothetical protein
LIIQYEVDRKKSNQQVVRDRIEAEKNKY